MFKLTSLVAFLFAITASASTPPTSVEQQYFQKNYFAMPGAENGISMCKPFNDAFSATTVTGVSAGATMTLNSHGLANGDVVYIRSTGSFEALGSPKSATMTNASPTVFTVTSHGWVEGTRIQLNTSGTLPTGLTGATYYYVRNPATSTFNVSLTVTGALINTSSAGSGSHTVTEVAGPFVQYFAQNVTTNTFEIGKTYGGTSLSIGPNDTFVMSRAQRGIDATGGTSTITVTKTISSPIAGTASYLFTKPASDVSGQGIACDFTIDRSAQARMLTVDFKNELVSGTYDQGSGIPGAYLDSDLTAWVYGPTDGTPTWTQISTPRVITGATSVILPFSGQFQTAASGTAYRLVFYETKSNIQTYAMKVDEFSVAQKAPIYGTPVTDWAPCTVTGTWTANTTYVCKKRRVGDSVDLDIDVQVSGAPTSATLTVNLPSDVTIDTSKRNASTGSVADSTGWTTVLDAGTNEYPIGTLVYASATTVSPRWSNGTGATAITQASPMTFASGDRVYIRIRSLPVAGWASNTVMSQDAGQRQVVASLSGGSTAGTNNTYQKITGISVVGDTFSAWDTTNNKYPVPVSGWYSISAVGNYASQGSASSAINRIVLYKNGVNFNENSVRNDTLAAVNQGLTCFVSGTFPDYYFNAGDYLEFYSFQNSGQTRAFAGITFNIHQVQGPQQIAASDSVYAKYQTTAGQSIANSGIQIVNFGTLVYETHSGAVTTGASWKFTAPASGLYRFSAGVSYTNQTYAAGNQAGSWFYKNGAIDTQLQYQSIETSTASVQARGGSTEIRLVAGDYVDFRVFNNRTAGATTLDTTATNNFITVSRIAP